LTKTTGFSFAFFLLTEPLGIFAATAFSLIAETSLETLTYFLVLVRRVPGQRQKATLARPVIHDSEVRPDVVQVEDALLAVELRVARTLVDAGAFRCHGALVRQGSRQCQAVASSSSVGSVHGNSKNVYLIA
jgi:hypothetical protein